MGRRLRQYAKGCIERYTLTYTNRGNRDDDQMNAAQARQVAALLLEAAAELECLDGVQR